jgi:Uma2 family endonuclease
MSVTAAAHGPFPVRRKATYEEYLALQETLNAEWLGGEVVVTPVGKPPHHDAMVAVSDLFRASLRDLHVYTGMAWFLPNGHERRPDVAAYEYGPGEDYPRHPPLIAVEVLSPSTRNEDLIHKPGEYLAAGVAQYWIVDPDAHTIEILEATDNGWERLAALDANTSAATVTVPGRGAVRLRLDVIVR